MMCPSPTTQRGQWAEDYACQHLQQVGLRVLHRNYQCRWGEIDLIMQDHSTVVFVEVRYRRSQAYGGALDSITQHKQQKIIATAQHYLQQQTQQPLCRFDVVVLTGAVQAPTVRWIQNAFGV